MTKIGYARVSSATQSTDVQVAALEAAGCDFIRTEKASGTTTEGRAELAAILAFARPGDTLVVTGIDRLARSIGDLLDIVRALKAKDVNLQATEQPFDTGDIYGEMTMQLLGVFADFETKLRRERQMEGIQKAKAAGIYRGRKAEIDAAEVKRLREEGLGATAIAKRLGIGRASVYRVLGEQGK